MQSEKDPFDREPLQADMESLEYAEAQLEAARTKLKHKSINDHPDDLQAEIERWAKKANELRASALREFTSR